MTNIEYGLKLNRVKYYFCCFNKTSIVNSFVIDVNLLADLIKYISISKLV